MKQKEYDFSLKKKSCSLNPLSVWLPQPQTRKEGSGAEFHVKTALCSKTLQQAEFIGLDLLLTPLILGYSVIFCAIWCFNRFTFDASENWQKLYGHK